MTVPLDDSLEGAFLDLISTDPVRYSTFLQAKPFDRGSISLAIEDGLIQGTMVISDGNRAEVDGSDRAAKALFDLLTQGEWTLSIPIGTSIPSIRGMRRINDDVIFRLRLNTMAVRPITEHEAIRLGVEDAEEISALLAEGDPVYWSKHTPEAIRRMMENIIWLGSRSDGRLVSVGCALVTEAGSNIIILATKKGHRGMGHGRSVLSTLISLALERGDVVMIHVLPENLGANRLYRSMGFRPHHSFRHIVGLMRTGSSEGSI